MKEKLAFVVGTGASLLSIALMANGVAQLQTGPKWEIPFAAATNWSWFGVISALLYLVGILSYFLGNRFESLKSASRKEFWLVLSLGIAMTVFIYSLDPGQWPITHQNLSAAARKASRLDCLRSSLDFVDSPDPKAPVIAPVTRQYRLFQELGPEPGGLIARMRGRVLASAELENGPRGIQ